MLRRVLPSCDARLERELRYWRESPDERPGAFTARLAVLKMNEATVFLEAVEAHTGLFENAATILELGAGQGWASCLVKSVFGGRVIASDVSPEAIASIGEWERIFGVEVDGALACPSFDLPLADESVDLAFTFQSAHHFGAHRRTLEECRRVLRRGGTLLYLHEPTSPRLWYGRAVARVNRKRTAYDHDVVEDVLVPSTLVELAASLGLRARVRYTPTLANRGPVEFLYYLALRAFKPAQRWLPCTAEFVFEKV